MKEARELPAFAVMRMIRSFHVAALAAPKNASARRLALRGAALERAALHVAHWEIVGCLASGRCADLWLARARGAAHASYVLKMLRPEWAEHAGARRRLAREAAVARQVKSAHLVPALAAHLETPPYYVVFPRLHGHSLQEEVAHGGLPWPLALGVIRQAAQALAALHNSGWTHGDIKPANIIVSRAGHVTLVDLEFARHRQDDAAEEPLFRTTLLGTPCYLSPEWLTGCTAPDIRGDIYGLGVVLYELLTGERPLNAASAQDLIRRQEFRAAELAQRCPWLPVEVVTLVRRAMASDVRRRLQSPAELVAQLVRLEIAALSR